MIFVDGHVHMYDCFDAGLLFDAALDNFMAAQHFYAGKDQAGDYVLLLSLGNKETRFRGVLAEFDKEKARDMGGGWYGVLSEEKDAVVVYKRENEAKKLYLVPGLQIVTDEKIEVLGLFCNVDIADGMPLASTVNTIQEKEGVPVIPWGVGKWFGRRGEEIEKYLKRTEKGTPLFVGDNGGRPVFWPRPSLLKTDQWEDMQLLSGSDPLPLADEVNRVGSFGFYVDESIPNGASPVPCLKNALTLGTKLIPYGKLLGPGNFLVKQLKLRFSA